MSVRRVSENVLATPTEEARSAGVDRLFLRMGDVVPETHVVDVSSLMPDEVDTIVGSAPAPPPVVEVPSAVVVVPPLVEAPLVEAPPVEEPVVAPPPAVDSEEDLEEPVEDDEDDFESAPAYAFVVADHSIPDITVWTGADKVKAQWVLRQEMNEEAPRKGVLTAMEVVLDADA